MTNRKSHTPVRLVPKSTTLDDRERPIRTSLQKRWVLGLSTTADFSVFAGYFFGYFRDEASFITWRYTVRCRLFSDPKMHDHEWPWMATPCLTLTYLTFGACAKAHQCWGLSLCPMRNPDRPHGLINLLEAFANVRRTVQWTPLRVSSERSSE